MSDIAIVKRTSGGKTRYYASVFVGGGVPRVSVPLGDNERKARKAHEELMSQYRRGAWSPVQDVRVRVLAKRWLEGHVTPNLRPTTAAALEGYWRRVWEPLLGDRLVSAVRAADVERYLADARKKGTSPSTATRAVKALSSLMEYGVRHGHLHANPVRKVVLPPAPRRQQRVLDAEGLRRVLAAAKRLGPQEHALMALAATAALRKGECLATRMQDLGDLYGSTPTVTVCGTAYRRQVLDGAKTAASAATVPLGELARNALVDWLLVRPTAADGGEGTVFCDKQGRPLPDNRPNAILRACLKEVGLPQDAVTVHGLRRTAASILAVNGGAAARTTQALLRHSTYAETNAAYEVVTAEHVRVAVDTLDAMLRDDTAA